MLSIIVIIAAFIGVTALVGGVAVVFRGESHRLVEDRLDALTSTRKVEPKGGSKEASLLAHPLDGDVPTVLEVFVSRFGNLRRLLEQADVSMQPAKFILCSIVMSIASAAVALFCGLSSVFVPVMAIAAGLVPLLLVIFKRKRRLNSFAKFLPDALELIARALRAGHSLAAGFKLVADEMSDPIGTEFGRVYEEQNLGIPLAAADGWGSGGNSGQNRSAGPRTFQDLGCDPGAHRRRPDFGNRAIGSTPRLVYRDLSTQRRIYPGPV